MDIDTLKINIIGDLSSNSGLSEASRGLVRAIQAIKSDIRIFDIVDSSHSSLRNFIASINKDAVNIWCINIHAVQKYMKQVLRCPGYNIAYWFWEISSMPIGWKRNFKGFQEIWTGSSFCRDNISKHSPVPVYVIPPVIELELHEDRYTRSYFGLPKDSFIFLFMYDMRSGRLRKNPSYVIKAFLKAFDSKNTEVKLAIKINNADQSEITHLLHDVPSDRCKSIYFFTHNMNREEVNGLLNCADSFVSLHKSEGFGMSIAEAMLLSKPVIATNWSGNVDFMNEHNSCPIKYRLIHNLENYGPYRVGCTWADPDIEHAAFQMSRIFMDKEFRRKLSANGKYTILNNFSQKQSSDSILQRLLHILNVQVNFSRKSHISGCRQSRSPRTFVSRVKRSRFRGQKRKRRT